MHKYEFIKTSIEGVIEIVPFSADDARGRFVKDYSKEIFRQNGIDYTLEENFYSISKKGVVRGLHFQREKMQAKLVQCVEGHIFDVVVDLRKGSPTFKKWIGFHLKGIDYHEILVPIGCAHGFLAIENSIVSYKCNEKFYGEYDDGIIWDDADIAIEWPLSSVGEKVILSEKDGQLQSFRDFYSEYGGFKVR